VAVFAEPTRGIDAAAAQLVHEKLASLAERGTAVVLVTSDFRELRRVADRYVVLWKHAFGPELGAETSDDVLAAAMATGGEGVLS
jgi:AI-2 transport system ATP-binding protein